MERPIIFLDSTPFIYYFENHPVFAERVRPIFGEIEREKVIGAFSVISLQEILVKPYKLNRLDLVVQYKEILTERPNLKIIPVSVEIAELAAKYRAEYHSLRTPDALLVASAKFIQADEFITFDRRLRQIKDLKVKVLHREREK